MEIEEQISKRKKWIFFFFFEWGHLVFPAAWNKVSLIVLIRLNLKPALGEAWKKKIRKVALMYKLRYFYGFNNSKKIYQVDKNGFDVEGKIYFSF